MVAFTVLSILLSLTAAQTVWPDGSLFGTKFGVPGMPISYVHITSEVVI